MSEKKDQFNRIINILASKKPIAIGISTVLLMIVIIASLGLLSSNNTDELLDTITSIDEINIMESEERYDEAYASSKEALELLESNLDNLSSEQRLNVQNYYFIAIKYAAEYDSIDKLRDYANNFNTIADDERYGVDAGSLVSFGEILAAQGLGDLAIQYYENALVRVQLSDDPEFDGDPLSGKLVDYITSKISELETNENL